MRRKGRASKGTTKSSISDEAQVAPSVGVEPAPNIVIEVDPGIFGGPSRNRFDLIVRGRVLSQNAVNHIAVTVAGRIVGEAFYRLDQASAVVMPDGTPASHRTFQFSLQPVLSDLSGQYTFQITARDESGGIHDQNFTLAFSPDGSTPISLVAGPSVSAEVFAKFPPEGFMHVERATLDDDGALVVEGWAVAFGTIQAIQITARGEHPTEMTLIGEAVRGRHRDDVGRALPMYPGSRQSGFNLTATLEAVDHAAIAVQAQILCQTGFSLTAIIPVELASRRGTPSTVAETTEHSGSARPDTAGRAQAVEKPEPETILSVFRMYCDAAELTADGILTVNGWAVCDAGIAQVRVMLDNQLVGLAACGHERFDVGSAFQDIPMADFSGFKFQSRVGDRYEGDHVVRVVVRSAQKAEIEGSIQVSCTAAEPEVVEQEPEPPLPEPVVEEPPEHSTEFRFELDAPSVVDGAVVEPVTGRLTIDGWLLSKSGIASFVVYLDDQRLGDAHYGLARQDVGAAFPEWPNSLRSGYAFHCPPRSLRDGDHTVRLAIRANNGREMERTFTMTVKKSDDLNDQTGIRRRVPTPETDLMMGLLTERDFHPSFTAYPAAGPVDRHRPDYQDATVVAVTGLQGLVGAGYRRDRGCDRRDTWASGRKPAGSTSPDLRLLRHPSRLNGPRRWPASIQVRPPTSSMACWCLATN